MKMKSAIGRENLAAFGKNTMESPLSTWKKKQRKITFKVNMKNFKNPLVGRYPDTIVKQNTPLGQSHLEPTTAFPLKLVALFSPNSGLLLENWAKESRSRTEHLFITKW